MAVTWPKAPEDVGRRPRALDSSKLLSAEELAKAVQQQKNQHKVKQVKS